MAVDERRRHELYLAFEDLVGPEVATTMMEHLPPVGWADVATKHDVDHLATVLRAEMAAGLADVRTELAEVRTEVAKSGQRVLMWTIGVMVPMWGSTFAAILATR